MNETLGSPVTVEPEGAYHYLYATSGDKCDYCQHWNHDLESTWSINAPLGGPKCHTQFQGLLTVFTVNKTWVNISFNSNRLVIYDDFGCVEYFSDANCTSKFLIANECLDNSTKAPANVTLFAPDNKRKETSFAAGSRTVEYHYPLRCYCFDYRYGPCSCFNSHL